MPFCDNCGKEITQKESKENEGWCNKCNSEWGKDLDDYYYEDEWDLDDDQYYEDESWH